MKKLTYLLFLAIGVTACSVESIDSTENLLTADAKFKVQEVEKSMTLLNETICEGEAPVFVLTFPQNTIGQGKTDVKIQVETTTGEWVSFKDLTYYDGGTKNYTYDGNLLLFGTYNFRASIGSGGFDYKATLEVDDCKTCDNLLIAELTCGDVNTLTITFTAEEAGPIVIQGGLNAKAIRIGGVGVGLEETTKPGASGNASVSRWEGNLTACQEVNVTINFTGGNSVGNWTAERNEVELGAAQAADCSSNE